MKKLVSCVVGIATLAPSPAMAQLHDWRTPVANYRVGCVYFDPIYRRTENRQHLGIDLPVRILRDRRGRLQPVNVISPVTGRVTRNWTNRSVNQAVLIIKEDTTRYEHVLGHITSSLRVGATVRRGQVVGTVTRWITPNGTDNTHVHWGANRFTVATAERTAATRRSISELGGGEWGWGRAPSQSTTRHAFNRGWMDLINYVRGRPDCR